MFEPLAPLKFSFAAPYFDQVRASIRRDGQGQGPEKICTLYQDDDSARSCAAPNRRRRTSVRLMPSARPTSAARPFLLAGRQDEGSPLRRRRDGPVIRETIGVIGTAKKLEWNPVLRRRHRELFEIIHKLGGALVNGFYSTCTVNNPYADDPNPKVREWFTSYKASSTRTRRSSRSTAGDHQPVRHRRGDSRQEPDARHAQQGDRNDQVPSRHVRRRREHLLGDQAPRHRPRDAVPNPDGKWNSVSEYLTNEAPSARFPSPRAAGEVVRRRLPKDGGPLPASGVHHRACAFAPTRWLWHLPPVRGASA